ncbi:hypothetical protein ACXO9E_05005 [Lactobacillus delbrueckii subsp. bulgaricus]|nr:hypothetical protein [Lactobacillus delbrueckii subsp. bulgaricus]
MASYGNTVLTSAGIDLVQRVIANTATFEITKVATSSDSRLTNATISTIEALTAMSSVQQTGKVTAFDTSNSKQVGLKCEFTNQGLTNQYDICGVGIYAKEAGKSEILFAVAPAKEPETMPAKPDDQSALFTFSLNMYVVVGQASAMTITATTEGVVKSINGTIKPDVNGNVTLPYYSQAEVDEKVSSLSTTVSNIKVGDRNLARGSASSKDWVVFQGFNNLTNYGYSLVNYSLDTLKAGDKVTFGITMRNDGITSGTMYFRQFGNVSQWTRDFSWISSYGKVTDFVPNGTERALTYTITITDGMLNGNSTYAIDIRTDNVPAGGKLSFRYAFVKKGTMATDWTPAPEDLEDAITSTKTIANVAKEKAEANANSIQALSNETTKAISSLNSTKTNNTDFDALKNRVAATESSVAATKDAVSSVKATADSLTTRMTNATGNISQLQQTAKGLQSTITDQSGKLSQLQQDADGLSATVGGAAVDLITNLDQPFVMGFGIANTTWQDNNSYIQLPTTKIHSEVLPQSAGFPLFIPWQAGKNYMQSIVFETDAKVTDGMQWTWYTNNGHMAEDATLAKLGNNTYRLIGSHTPTASEVTQELRVFDIWNFTDVVDVTTGTYLKFRNPRIWCPDDNSLAQLKLTADGLTSKVSSLSTTVSNIKVGDRNVARGVASSQDWFVFQGFNDLTNYCIDLADYSLDTLKAGDKVTFGIIMKNDGITSGTMVFLQYGNVSQWTRDYSQVSSPANVTDFVPNGTEKALTYTIPITDGMLNGNSTYTIRLRTDNVPAGGKLSFRYAFVKKGTMATDWTPAPEDLEDDITSTKAIANTAKDKAEANANSIKALSDETTKAISSLGSTMTRLMLQAAYVPTQIGDKTDLNSMKTCGFYLLQGETINSPVDGWVYVKVQGIPTRLNQFAWQDINPAEQWCRWYDGSNWLPWVHYAKAI